MWSYSLTKFYGSQTKYEENAATKPTTKQVKTCSIKKHMSTKYKPSPTLYHLSDSAKSVLRECLH